MFLEQYWGGPTTYSEQRGHPRLRMRHAPFAVTPEQRDRWLTHMRDAVDSLDLSPEYSHELWSYLERAAYSMVNTFDDDHRHPGLGRCCRPRVSGPGRPSASAWPGPAWRPAARRRPRPARTGR